MPLTLVTGRANAGKTGAAYDAVRNAAREGRNPVLIMPSEPDAERARRELARDVSLGLRVTTFERHVAAAWALHGDGRAIVTPGLRLLLLARIREQQGLLPAGHEELVVRAVERLADRLGESWRSCEVSDEGAAEVLGRGLSAYAKALSTAGLVEPGEAYDLLCTRETFGGDPIVAHRFTDLTHTHRSTSWSLRRRVGPMS